MLLASDEILGRVEDLRLEESRAVPPQLRDAIADLQARLGRSEPPVAPGTLQAAHDLVLALQQRLMAANPRVAQTRAHPRRGAGQPMNAPVSGAGRWKLLTMPAPPPAGVTREWLDLVDAMVERASDRWAYAQHQAVRAARDRRHPVAALARLRAAWENYWQLKLEAERLRRRLPSPGWLPVRQE